MGILSRIGWGIWDTLTSVGHSILQLFGLERISVREKRKIAKAEANAELRRQWLEVGKDEMGRWGTPEEGVEWDGEMVYDTIK